MQIHRDTDRSADGANPEYFTGEVTVRPICSPEGHSALAAAEVTFAAGARTNWHTHPVGQTLLITDGKGWVQRENEAKIEVGVGDVVRFAPGERHWHGATDTDAMTHVAMQEHQNGTPVAWAEPVSDADYAGRDRT